MPTSTSRRCAGDGVLLRGGAHTGLSAVADAVPGPRPPRATTWFEVPTEVVWAAVAPSLEPPDRA